MILNFEHQTTQILDEMILSKVHKYRSAIIWGSGESGDWVRKYIESEGVIPVCYIDNYKPKQGTEKNGLMIFSFEDAISKYEDACICIGSLWADEIIGQIKKQNPKVLERTLDFRGAMVWEIKEKLFKSEEAIHIKNNIAGYDNLLIKLHDDESKRVMKGILNYRITRDGKYLKEIVSDGEEYIDRIIVPDNLFNRPNGEIVDGGAFDGDTIEGLFRNFNTDGLTIHCYEPSKVNADRIRNKKMLWNNINIIVHESGLQAHAGSGALVGTGFGGVIVSEELKGTNTDSVSLECIDNVNWNDLRMIKLDIEGAERDALLGGLKSIKKFRPVLSICVYHRQDDLLAISEFISNIDNYRIYLRHYMNATSETIMYGIPEELYH